MDEAKEMGFQTECYECGSHVTFSAQQTRAVARAGYEQDGIPRKPGMDAKCSSCGEVGWLALNKNLEFIVFWGLGPGMS